jgi:ABC-type transport system involved in multi-copper enzyme maturation permease subunit
MGTIYRLTLMEMIRKKFLMLVLILAGIFLIFYGVGLYFMIRDLWRIDSPFTTIYTTQMLSFAVYVSSFLSALLVVFSVSGTLAGEIENGILHSIIPKPIRRGEIMKGKFLGVATMSILFSILLLTTILGVSWLVTHRLAANLPMAFAYYCLQPLVLLSVTGFFSVLLPPIAAGVTGIMLYMIGIIGGMLEQIGVILNNPSLVNTGIISSLLIPTDPLYRLIYAAVTPKVGGTLANANPFGAASLPSVWMVVYAIFYILLFFGLTIRTFNRKEL